MPGRKNEFCKPDLRLFEWAMKDIQKIHIVQLSGSTSPLCFSLQHLNTELMASLSCTYCFRPQKIGPFGGLLKSLNFVSPWN